MPGVSLVSTLCRAAGRAYPTICLVCPALTVWTVDWPLIAYIFFGIFRIITGRLLPTPRSRTLRQSTVQSRIQCRVHDAYEAQACADTNTTVTIVLLWMMELYAALVTCKNVQCQRFQDNGDVAVTVRCYCKPTFMQLWGSPGAY